MVPNKQQTFHRDLRAVDRKKERISIQEAVARNCKAEVIEEIEIKYRLTI